VDILSGGIQATKKVIPEVKEVDKKKTKLIGIESGVEYVQPKLIIAKADNFGVALVTAFQRTWDGIVKTFSGYKKLITREVSLNNIGGPLAIGKVASDSLNISFSMFFRLMAIISINLGVINLFPIPVLDGGHIMFLIFETFNGGPLSRKKLEIAQRFGVSVLFLLIFVALFNDITRLF
jgi:regulator of sigma E protease